MKKSLLSLAAFFVMAASLTAQNFVSTDNQWNVLLTALGMGGITTTTEIYFLEGDSVHIAKNYKVMWVSYDSLVSGNYAGLVREAGDRVYYVPPNSNSEGLLYDFALEAGESTWIRNIFSFDDSVQVTILEVDTVEYMGVERRRLAIEGINYDFWIKGIGSTMGPVHSQYEYFVVCPSWELLCFHHQNELLYIMPNMDECWLNTVGIDELSEQEIVLSPNPVLSGQAIRIQSPVKFVSIKIINNTGAVVYEHHNQASYEMNLATGSLNPGIYLLEIQTAKGRKLIRKILVR